MLLSFATCTYSAQFLNVRHNNSINKLSESQLSTDYSRKRIGSCQSDGLMRMKCLRPDCVRRPDKNLSNGKRTGRNTYLYFIFAFQFRKPVKAAHIKDALFYSIGFHCVGRAVKNNKELFYL